MAEARGFRAAILVIAVFEWLYSSRGDVYRKRFQAGLRKDAAQRG
jgi:hypothetical protein